MRCVILGFGFLAQYILPCVEPLLQGRPENLMAVKATERGLDALRRRYAFPIRVGGAREALEEMRPDLIVISVKPHQVEQLLADAVAPYLRGLRREGAEMPDIYSFAARPSVGRYIEVLGEDVNVACMIPNMLRSVEGRDIAAVGVSFLSFDPRSPWSEERRARALRFLEPTGTVVEIDPEIASAYIALNCACHMMFEFNFIAQEALRERGMEVGLDQTAQTYRRAFHELLFDEPCARVVPCDGLNDTRARATAACFMRGWHDGLLDGALEAGIPHEAARRNICGSMEAFQIEVQLESRDVLIETTRQHATPGGFLECAISRFTSEGLAYCASAWRDLYDERAGGECEGRIREIARDVLAATIAHGARLGGASGQKT